MAGLAEIAIAPVQVHPELVEVGFGCFRMAFQEVRVGVRRLALELRDHIRREWRRPAQSIGALQPCSKEVAPGIVDPCPILLREEEKAEERKKEDQAGGADQAAIARRRVALARSLAEGGDQDERQSGGEDVPEHVDGLAVPPWRDVLQALVEDADERPAEEADGPDRGRGDDQPPATPEEPGQEPILEKVKLLGRDLHPGQDYGVRGQRTGDDEEPSRGPPGAMSALAPSRPGENQRENDDRRVTDERVTPVDGELVVDPGGQGSRDLRGIGNGQEDDDGPGNCGREPEPRELTREGTVVRHACRHPSHPGRDQGASAAFTSKWSQGLHSRGCLSIETRTL